MFGRKAAQIAELEFELHKAKLYIAKLRHDLENAQEWDDYNLRLIEDRDATIRRLTNEILEPKVVNADLKARP